MKKHLLILSMGVAASAFAATAYADNNRAYTSQTGTGGNAITINQNDTGTDVRSVTAGSGGGNTVGTTDKAFLQTGAGSNTLTVDQTGTGNSLGSAVQGKQDGSANKAAVIQAGTSGRVELQQTGTNNGGASGTSKGLVNGSVTGSN
ncbi:hypothetical protein FV229_26885, partial [Methylobacterium sp. WL120]